MMAEIGRLVKHFQQTVPSHEIPRWQRRIIPMIIIGRWLLISGGREGDFVDEIVMLEGI